MLNPPITDNTDLNSFLTQVFLDYQNNSSVSNSVVSTNTSTGSIADNSGNLVGYLYRYLDVKYADDAIGTNISDNPYSRTWFGVRNDDTVIESLNPAAYTWYEVADGGFGISKVLWVATTGGRFATFAVSTEAPDDSRQWRIVPQRSIDLDNPSAVFNQYLIIRYADDSVGTGLSTTPTNKTYYGIYTSTDGSTSVDPTLFDWSPFTFGTTYELYYRAYGGRNIDVLPAQTRPLGYLEYKGDVLNLDVSTLGTVDTIGIISEAPLIIESPYRYLLVQYATSITGTSISNDPSGKTYYGLQASDVLTVDNNPADYTWFAAGGTFLTTVNLWVRTNSSNVVQFSLTQNAPDNSGWQNICEQSDLIDYIDMYQRTGSVVTGITSPTDGNISYYTNTTGITNVNLTPYGQGSTTSGFDIDITTTATIGVDQFGRVYRTGASDQVLFSSMLTTATSGQTVFTFSNAQTNQILVFRNGAFLKPGTDYTRTTTTVTFSDACAVNDKIAIYYIRLIDGATSADKVPFITTSSTLTDGQTYISSTSANGSELLFINGTLIVDSDYDYFGTAQGYTLKTASKGGNCDVVTFSFNASSVLIFGENITETIISSNNVVFPTPYYRNSHLMFLNGVLLRPTSDYSIPGSTSTSYNLTEIGTLNIAGQPYQYCSFNKYGEASASSVSAAGVLGMDMPVVIDQKPTIADMFKVMQDQIDELRLQVKGQTNDTSS